MSFLIFGGTTRMRLRPKRIRGERGIVGNRDKVAEARATAKRTAKHLKSFEAPVAKPSVLSKVKNFFTRPRGNR